MQKREQIKRDIKQLVQDEEVVRTSEIAAELDKGDYDIDKDGTLRRHILAAREEMEDEFEFEQEYGKSSQPEWVWRWPD